MPVLLVLCFLVLSLSSLILAGRLREQEVAGVSVEGMSHIIILPVKNSLNAVFTDL